MPHLFPVPSDPAWAVAPAVVWLLAIASPAASRRWYWRRHLRNAALVLAPSLVVVMVVWRGATVAEGLREWVVPLLIALLLMVAVVVPQGYPLARFVFPPWSRELARLESRPGDPAMVPSRWRRHAFRVQEQEVALCVPRMWSRSTVSPPEGRLLDVAGPSGAPPDTPGPPPSRESPTPSA